MNLGIDVLTDPELGGPADILLGQNIIRMGNMSIPCLEVHDPPTSRRVTTADHCIIPSHSQAVIDEVIHWKSSDTSQERPLVIEATSNFISTYPLVMADTLVDFNTSPTVKVRVMNPFDKDVSIKQDAVVGEANVVDPDVDIVAELSPESEIEIPNPANCGGRIRVRQNRLAELPEHLYDLYNCAIHGKSETLATAPKACTVSTSRWRKRGCWTVAMTGRDP